jgi:broad specificity phosphatase PhoE
LIEHDLGGKPRTNFPDQLRAKEIDVMAFSRRTVALGGLFAALVLVAPVPSIADDINLASMLRAGGLVILLRHGPTNPNQAEGERNLNDAGKQMAGNFGEALRQIRAPVGKVYTSELNRAYQMAVLARFTVIDKTADLTETSTSMGKPADIEAGRVVSSDEKGRRADALRKMLGTEPDEGTNTIIITHKPNITDALGEGWADVREGEAAIFRPHNGSYRLIARVQMDDWPRLAAAK